MERYYNIGVHMVGQPLQGLFEEHVDIKKSKEKTKSKGSWKKYGLPAAAIITTAAVGTVAYFGIVKGKTNQLTGEELNKAINVPRQTELTKTPMAVEKDVGVPDNPYVEKNIEHSNREPRPIPMKIVFKGRDASMLKKYFGYTEKELLEYFDDYKIIVREYEGRKSYDLEGFSKKEGNKWIYIRPKLRPTSY